MTPRDLGCPEKFTSFRPVQEDIFEFCLTSEKRVIGIGAPPGVGKTLASYGLHKLFGGRTVVLTSSKGLQDQYLADGFSGAADVRGRANYSCWCGGTCEDGARQNCKDFRGCPYRSAVKEFNEAEFGITSYAMWLASFEHGNGLALPDTLICDEAAESVDWISRSLDFHIGERECREGGYPLAPLPGEDIPEWIARIPAIQATAERALLMAKGKLITSLGAARHEKSAWAVKRAEQFVDRAAKMARLDAENWVCSREDGTDDGRLWRFECIWPHRYRERLFQYVPRVILMSATLRPKTLSLLGVKADDADFKEWGRQFPAANGPVIWIPTARINHRVSVEDKRKWLDRIGEICAWGRDRKGLIHTVSYLRAKEIAEDLGKTGASNLILNGAADPDTASARQSYDRFVAAPDGSVLISPSFGVGWDFKGKRAEWQIISKIAFPDTRSKVMQARCDDDRSYPNYLAAQDLVQSCGRIVRSKEDLGCSLIIDDSLSWFKKLASDYLPKFFQTRREFELPRPLPKIQ